MSLVVDPPVPSPQERAWAAAEAESIAVMGTVNAAVARLVAAVRDLLEADGWQGWGIHSPEHWLCWKANVSRSRAAGLVRIARRVDELPACWALFESGRLGEDAMVRIARRVPADRDADVAALAPELLISQLDRLLRSLPDLPDPHAPPARSPERTLQLSSGRDGWLRGRFCLPPDEGAVVQNGLAASRDAELRDRHDLDPEAEVHPDAAIDPYDAEARARQVAWADGLVRMAAAATDALDADLRRTGNAGDRHQVVVHCDIDPDGRLGPGQLELGPTVPDAVTRYLACDARVLVAAHRAGRLVGLQPTDRRPNRATRRYLARRDQGCRHPLCHQRRWLHAHHLVFWDDGGLTVPANLVLLCPRHHRALHQGELSIEGDPEAGTLRFRDRFGRLLTAPTTGPSDDPLPATYAPPRAERVRWDDVTWN
jgi:hypothetical protein